ncbi:hypothetical protein TTHERM_000530169 (macronuclear) [Tetrahymena thermophila SB210]|uniref:Uncharacterized protein n=1 Tax=Tetrahymena thermophila (strain SB210) TaxID=312017 RepID=W7X030_TETTS|nr:hypothetical protein TTHERM_000530169 [Tetrahymena thermophila SB210]EWS72465.1 hypothetical protein TTHERM_000530169 [Tetrahymena thermophila SB210]|eukprot:XP_012655010.1 hypothetical protein TTHERM_000530169 [Tetrahymena thermophila SB210]
MNSKNQTQSHHFLSVPRQNVKLDPIQMSPLTSTLKRKEMTEKELKRKEKQEEYRSAMNNQSEGVWSLINGMNTKVQKIDSLVNQYQDQMEYVNSNGIQQYLKKAYVFYKNDDPFDPSDPLGQRTYANQYIYRKKLPTSFYYIERQKIRERIQLNTQMQFFHPEWFEHKKQKNRQRQDIDYLKLLAQRKEIVQKEPAPKHIPLNLNAMSSNRKAVLDEFYSKDTPNKVQKICELQKKLIPEQDIERIEQLKKIHEQELLNIQSYKKIQTYNYL